MLTRFIQMQIKDHPKKDGSYPVYYKPKKGYDRVNFTVECGWNTSRMPDGTIHSDCAMSDEALSAYHTHWLKPYNIGSENWCDQLEEMMEEIKGELYQYADRKLTDDEMWACSNLEDMYDLLERAKDYAEAYR